MRKLFDIFFLLVVFLILWNFVFKQSIQKPPENLQPPEVDLSEVYETETLII